MKILPSTSFNENAFHAVRTANLYFYLHHSIDKKAIHS